MTAPVRMGVLGAARIVESALIAPARAGAGVEVVAVAARDPARGADYAARHGLRAASYEALVADPTIEAVYVALPNALHCEWTIRALEAGKAVLCEKPFAANRRQAQAMADASVAAGRVLMEAMHWRWHPLARRVEQILRSGLLGGLQAAEVRFLIPAERIPDGDIRVSYALGGGATMDAGCYCVDFLRMALGEPLSVLKAQAVIRSPEVDAEMTADLLFEAGRTGRFTVSHIHPGPFQLETTITGDAGRLTLRNPFLPQWGAELVLDVAGVTTRERLDPTPSYDFQAHGFANLVRGAGGPDLTPAANGIGNLRAIDMVYLAAGLRPRGEHA